MPLPESSKRAGHRKIPAGLYVHFPFCLKKCPYCNFYSITDLSFKNNFLTALVKEMESYRDSSLVFDSIYLGGGTPSILNGKEMECLLDKFHIFFKIQENAEITIEANPATVDAKVLCQYSDAGINRLNIGVQSFCDTNLDFLGRLHSSRDARMTIDAARNAGFDNIGIDLIYGLPGQNIDTWQKDIETAMSFLPEHLSCYMLSCEKDTPLYCSMEAGLFLPIHEALAGHLFGFTWKFLSEKGYTPYEISNFSRHHPEMPGLYRSRHNQKYWQFAPYLGLGPAAHSYLEPVRYWNKASVGYYIQQIESGQSPVETREYLNREQQIIETVFLGLRTTDGIDLERFETKFGTVFFQLFSNLLSSLTEKGYMDLTDTRCSLTPLGMRFHDSICKQIVTAI